LLVIGTRLWSLGKRHGFITPVQMFRDRWECGHIGTAIFAVQTVLLVPYIIIAVIGGGTTLQTVSNGAVPFWLGGAIVSLVVMTYVFLGGMRGTAWVNAFQSVLFLLFGAIAVSVVGAGMGGFSGAMERLFETPDTAPLLTRERISPFYFFSYTFIPLSSIAFPHIAIFCLTAKRLAHFKKTIVLYPICMLLIWLPSVFLGVVANQATSVPAIQAKLEARATLASAGQTLAAADRARLRVQAGGDDVILRLVEGFAPTFLAALLAAAVMAGGDGQRFANPGPFDHVHPGRLRLLWRHQTIRRPRAGADRSAVRDRPHVDRIPDCAALTAVDLRSRDAVRIRGVRGAVTAAGRRHLLAPQHQVGRPREHGLDGRRGGCCRRRPDDRFRRRHPGRLCRLSRWAAWRW
jgi:hypothetical protein